MYFPKQKKERNPVSLDWSQCILLRYLFTPLAVTYRKHGYDSYIGFMNIYIFGIRVARIQRTAPW